MPFLNMCFSLSGDETLPAPRATSVSQHGPEYEKNNIQLVSQIVCAYNAWNAPQAGYPYFEGWTGVKSNWKGT